MAPRRFNMFVLIKTKPNTRKSRYMIFENSIKYLF